MPRRDQPQVLTKKEIGERLKVLRRELDISQAELAQRLGTYQTIISAIERGRRGLTLQQVMKLSSALGVPPHQLLTPANTATQPQAVDRRFMRRLEKIGRLPKRDQQALLRTIDAFLGKVS